MVKIESEKLLEKKLGKAVKAVGGWSIKLLPTFISGIPDRLCLFQGGRVCFVELKTTKQKVRLIQREVHKKLAKIGFTVIIIDTSEGIKNLIEKYAN